MIRLRSAPWAFAGACDLAYLAVVIGGKLPDALRQADFMVYHEAGRALLRGEPIYAVPGYIYPPAFAVLVLPFALLPPAAAKGVWFGLNLLFLAITLRHLLRLCDLDREAARAAAALFALSPPVVYTLVLGQVNLLLAALLSAALAIGLRGDGRRSEGVPGALFGLAAAIKVYPAAYALALAAGRRWRALAAMAVAGVVLAFAGLVWGGGPAGWHTFRVKVLPGLARAMPILADNQSTPAVAARLLAPQTHVFTVLAARHTIRTEGLVNLPGAVPWAAAALTLVILGLTLAACLRIFRRRGPEELGVGVALVTPTLLLVTPIVWDHYYVLLALPLALFWRHREILGGRLPVLLAAVASLVGIQRFWRPLFVAIPSPLLCLWGWLAVFLVWLTALRLARLGPATGPRW